MITLLADGIGPLALLIRATALLLGALVIGRVMRQASPLARHALWATTTLALLALPFLQQGLPRLAIPGWQGNDVAVEATIAARTVTAVAPMGVAEVQSGSPLLTGSVPVPPVDAGPALPSLATLLLFGWIAGATVIAASIALGIRRARRLTRRAVAVTSPRLLARFDWARRMTGVSRAVALRVAPDVRTPMTGGLWHPVVLLPNEAMAWDDALLDSVLRHELIHVRRMDAFHQIASRCSVALYWFHPMAWRAAQHASTAREAACDAAVLALGTRPSHYARHLLALAEHGNATPLIPAFARLHHPTLEDRVMSILESSPSRTSSRRTLLSLATLAAWSVIVASAGPATAQSAPPPPVAPPTAESPRAPLPAPRVMASVPRTPPTAPAPDAAPNTPPAVATAPRPSVLSDVQSLPAAPAVPAARAVPAPPSPRTAPPAPLAADCELGTTGVKVGSSTGARGPVKVTTRTVGGRAICLAIRGAMPAGLALNPMPRLPDGVVLTLAARGSTGLQQLVITGTPKGNSQLWRVNGQPRTFDKDAMAWRDAMLQVMAERDERPVGRATAPTAEARVRATADRAQAVAEVESSVAARQAKIEAEQAARVLEQTVVATERARCDADVARRSAEVSASRAKMADVRERRSAEVVEAQARQLIVERKLLEERVAERGGRVIEYDKMAREQERAVALLAERDIKEARADVAVARRLITEQTAMTPAAKRLVEMIEKIGGR